MKNFLQTIILFIVFSYIININKITFKLEKGEDLCLSEYFPHQVLVVYEIKSDEKIAVEVHDIGNNLKAYKV